MNVKTGLPIIDLSALGSIDQSRCYTRLRERAIKHPEMAVSCRFKMSDAIRRLVNEWLNAGGDRFYLAS